MDNPLIIFLVIIALLFVGFMLVAIVQQNHFNDEIKDISDKGYDGKDVAVFLKSFDYEPSEFLESKGLREQYKSWSEGKSFANERLSVIVKKNSKKAKSNSAAAIGLSTAAIATRSIR